MASIKELKKEIDNSFAELGMLCHVAMATAEDTAREDEIAGVYSDAVDRVAEVMKMMSQRSKEMNAKEVKAFFKAIRKELTELFSGCIDQVSKMVTLDSAAQS